jgi:hypothetical protein
LFRVPSNSNPSQRSGLSWDRALAHRLGPQMARAAYTAGLAVTLSDGGTRPIPLTGTPVVLPDSELERRAHLSHLVTSATFKMARAALQGWLRDELLNGLSPFERELALATAHRQEHLATVRVDYFVADRPYALEVNATIPAMQAYSDIAAESFIRAAAGVIGMNESQTLALLQRNGSNARALYEALRTSFAAERGKEPKQMALLCRRNDAQYSELAHLAAHFSAWGTPAEVVYPDEATYDGTFYARGRPFDLVYRHLFVRRLEQLDAPAIKRFYAEAPGGKTSLLNGPASHVEVKAVFAELSRALADPELAQEAGLTDDELGAVQEAVPWTRRFRPGPGKGPQGERITDIVEHVAAEPARFVLKRSWDYGGKQVFLGNTVGEPVYEDRIRAAYGRALSWRELCQEASRDQVGGGFVVQEVVLTQPEPHLLCTADEVRPVELFVDYSGYASVGPAQTAPWGGVCRGSVSRIVNIVGGGGVIPLLRQSVAAELEDGVRRAMRTWD